MPTDTERQIVHLTLPFAPSVNHYWRHVGHRVLISERGRDYRERVAEAVLEQRDWPNTLPLLGRLNVVINFHPPTRQRRDLDNFLKAILDSMQSACVYRDDWQIDRLEIIRREVRKPGRLIVTLEEIVTDCLAPPDAAEPFANTLAGDA